MANTTGWRRGRTAPRGRGSAPRGAGDRVETGDLDEEYWQEGLPGSGSSVVILLRRGTLVVESVARTSPRPHRWFRRGQVERAGGLGVGAERGRRVGTMLARPGRPKSKFHLRGLARGDGDGTFGLPMSAVAITASLPPGVRATSHAALDTGGATDAVPGGSPRRRRGRGPGRPP